jgi:hypothetical protein
MSTTLHRITSQKTVIVMDYKVLQYTLNLRYKHFVFKHPYKARGLQYITLFPLFLLTWWRERMITDRNLWITWMQSLWNIWRTIWFGHLIRIWTGHHSLCAMWPRNHSQAACDALNCFVSSSTHCTIVGWKIMSELQKCNLNLLDIYISLSVYLIMPSAWTTQCQMIW